MSSDGTDVQTSPATLESALWKRGLAYWRVLGLTGQFLLVTIALFLVLSWMSGLLQASIVERGMLADALRLETKLMQAAVEPHLPETPILGRLEPAREDAIRSAIARHLDHSVISKVKMWSVDGVLLFDSSGAATAGMVMNAPDGHVMRAVRGETLTERADAESAENGFDHGFGQAVYEVYSPLVSEAGHIVAVGEVYAATERYAAQVEGLIGDIAKVRFAAALLGVAGLLVLVQFAHRRMQAQEAALRDSWIASERLAQHNIALLAESEAQRHVNIARNEQLLTQVGYDLHDGPVQLLGLAAMYLATIERATETPALVRTQELLTGAVDDLRRISSGLILPDLGLVTLAATTQTAVAQFSHLTGVNVDCRIAPVDPHWPDAAKAAVYRILFECLQNGLRHAGGKGLEVDLSARSGQIVLTVADRGPGPSGSETVTMRAGRVRMGLRGIRERLRDMGGTIDLSTRPGGGTCVTITIPESLRAHSGGHEADPVDALSH